MKKLQVLVVFEFEGIEKEDSPEADIAIEEVIESISGLMSTEWNSPGSVSIWTDTAFIVEEDE